MPRLLSALVVGGALLAAAAPALANGRPPGTSTIHFKKGAEATDIVAGMTFGLVTSHDSGATWNWMCEDAVGYSGMYDPSYSYSSSGALFATTFVGLKVMRDSCTFNAVPAFDTVAAGSAFVSVDMLGPDGTLHFAVSDPHDSDIYGSTDDGMTYPAALKSMPGQLNDWWQSLAIAPSDGQTVYLAGYRIDSQSGGGKTYLLFRSTNGGGTWTALSTTGLAIVQNSAVEIAGIDPTDPTLVYARVKLSDDTMGDTLYRSTDAGANWTMIYTAAIPLDAFVVRYNHDLVLGTQTSGAYTSHDHGDNWTTLTGAPHLNCLVEQPGSHDLWGCTQNYGSSSVPSDNAGIMKTSDLATWTSVMRYQDIKAPVTCPSGTPQHDTCDVQNWCTLCAQLGCTVTDRNCNTQNNPEAPAATADAASPGKTSSSGCCDAGGGAPGASLLAAGIVGAAVMRRRRNRAKLSA
ncbi:MAG TPA: hypothetical protein VGM88_21005 [Kofleriaceae bacterium]|jgi:hypothetical protein